ncbi:MAG TPA: sulfatase-like hydrolase/transferase [Candidatus Binataceae bacterium]|nr:sulfatase-like hydrolase/transferase [Candidatus Binataceae bacterium]
MGRKILFITTDQQRYDALGCNGGRIARTPAVDALAATGINYRRAYNQNTVCTPARSTMLTGQYARTHGVVANGIALPAEAPSVAAWLRERARYRTALIGKAHFEPALDLNNHAWPENRMALDGSHGPHRGFEYMELAMHGPMGNWHYSVWMRENFPAEAGGFVSMLAGPPGGDTGAVQVAYNPMPRGHYHTDWIAERTIAYLDRLADDEDWFVWMSFPDPHHPWDPPASEARRINWRELDLPPGHPGSREKIEKILAQKPRHWLDWYEGRFRNNEGTPVMTFVPCQMSHDQVREINALVHVKNELIDEACARVLGRIAERGWDRDTDVFFTTDHGELQGDFGLLFKGPYHVDALMRVPLVWRPAPSAKVAPAQVSEPVGHLDLAPTFCAVAGLPAAPWMQGRALPTAPGSGRERVITEWDSQFAQIGMHLRTIYRDGYVLTVYEPTTRDWGFDLAMLYTALGIAQPLPDIRYAGSEGELYNLEEDPLQWRNLWNDPGYARLKSDLRADLYDNLPPPRKERLPVDSPV